VLLFLNGPMGVGKTQVAFEFARRVRGGFVCDPERLGKAIQRMTPPSLAEEWQFHSAWRSGVVDVASGVASRHDGVVVLPATILDKAHHAEIIGGLRERGHDVHHFSLLASPETLIRRLRSRGDGRGSYGAKRIEICLAALSEPEFATHIRTDGLDVPSVAEEVAASIGVGLEPRRSSVRQYWDRLIVKAGHIGGLNIG
jgi:predicted kinase